MITAYAGAFQVNTKENLIDILHMKRMIYSNDIYRKYHHKNQFTLRKEIKELEEKIEKFSNKRFLL